MALSRLIDLNIRLYELDQRERQCLATLEIYQAEEEPTTTGPVKISLVAEGPGIQQPAEDKSRTTVPTNGNGGPARHKPKPRKISDLRYKQVQIKQLELKNTRAAQRDLKQQITIANSDLAGSLPFGPPSIQDLPHSNEQVHLDESQRNRAALTEQSKAIAALRNQFNQFQVDNKHSRLTEERLKELQHALNTRLNAVEETMVRFKELDIPRQSRGMLSRFQNLESCVHACQTSLATVITELYSTVRLMIVDEAGVDVLKESLHAAEASLKIAQTTYTTLADATTAQSIGTTSQLEARYAKLEAKVQEIAKKSSESSDAHHESPKQVNKYAEMMAEVLETHEKAIASQDKAIQEMKAKLRTECIQKDFAAYVLDSSSYQDSTKKLIRKELKDTLKLYGLLSEDMSKHSKSPRRKQSETSAVMVVKHQATDMSVPPIEQYAHHRKTLKMKLRFADQQTDRPNTSRHMLSGDQIIDLTSSSFRPNKRQRIEDDPEAE